MAICRDAFQDKRFFKTVACFRDIYDQFGHFDRCRNFPIKRDANLSRFNAKQQQVLHIGAENRQLMTKSAYDRFGCFFNSDQNPQQLVDLECIPTGKVKNLSCLATVKRPI